MNWSQGKRNGRPWRQWTTEEEEFLRANYGRLSPPQLATQLGRRITAIWSKAQDLDLNQKRGPRLVKVAERHPPQPVKVIKPFTFDPTPCSERELGYGR